MAMGLLSGIRALIWAIVLLMAPWSEGPVGGFLALKKCWFVVGLVGSNLNRGMPPASFQGCVGCERERHVAPRELQGGDLYHQHHHQVLLRRHPY